jgi:Fe-Mn family superoxide dismutase
MRIAFPDLPYPVDALEPACSARAVSFHYDKHHRGYFEKTVELIKGSRYQDMTLEQIIESTAQEAKSIELFNNAAQAWNHDKFWHSMRPDGGGEPPERLERLIAKDFGSVDRLRHALRDRGVRQFGSGWAWLAFDGDKLFVTSTSNADNPLIEGAAALLAIDVWEHAYYLDYQNRRQEFVDAFLDRLVNWQHAAESLDMAIEGGIGRDIRRARRRRA